MYNNNNNTASTEVNNEMAYQLNDNYNYNDNNSDNNYTNNIKDEHEHEHQKEDTLDLSKHGEKMELNFDYEINIVKLDENEDLNCKMYYFDKTKKQYRIINYNSFNDKLLPLYKINPKTDKSNLPQEDKDIDMQFDEREEEPLPRNAKNANCIKRLVSKQKRRFQDEHFDLDMTYITERVIAMGFPSTGCETLYRNALADVQKFFHMRHKNNVKIYNLCIEKDRIYPKHLFQDKCQVGLFPATDHNPCPIKLILEFCVDICLYLIMNPEGIAAVHCKAGKGRTGVMICSYLIFSNLCNTSEKAFRYYARIRTKDNTGVTIPSQQRYIRYFQSFLEANFCPPFIFLIPKIIKNHFTHFYSNERKRYICNNILKAFKEKDCYFVSPNKFALRNLEVGPLPKNKVLTVKICNFINNNISKDDIQLEQKGKEDMKGNVYYTKLFDPPLIIKSDIKISISGIVNFYVWVNLWYSTWETLKRYHREQKEPEEKINNSSVNSVGNNVNNNNNNNDVVMKPLNESHCSSRKMISQSEKSNDVDSEMNEKDKDSSKEKLSLYEVIFKLGINPSLNSIINKVNQRLRDKVDKQNLVISLNASQLDKFEEKKKITDIKLNILYSLTDK